MGLSRDAPAPGHTSSASTKPTMSPLTACLLSLAAPIFAPMSLVFFSWAMLNPVLPLLVRQLGGGDGAVGIATSARSIGGLLLTLPSGFLASRFGCKKVAMVGISLYLTGCILGGFSTTVPQLIGTRVLCGIAYSLYVIPAQVRSRAPRLPASHAPNK